LLDDWYHDLGRKLVSQHPLPDPLSADSVADGRLVAAVRRDLSDNEGKATSTAVRIIWTGDYLDAIRRLQPDIVEPVNLLRRDVATRTQRRRKSPVDAARVE
jgi:hypothetical protein